MSESAPSSTSAPSAQPVSSSGADSSADDAAARLIQRNYRGYRTRRSLAGCNISADARWDDAVSRMRINNAAVDSRNSEKNDVASRWKRGGVLVGQLAGSPGTGPGAAKGKGKGDDGPVEGGPSLGPEAGSEGGQHAAALAQRTGKEAMVGDVPGANENGKVDNIPSIAGKGGKHEHGLRLIERWTRGAKAQELSKAMEEAYWLEMVDTKHRYGSNLKHYHAEWSKADTKDNFFKWLDEGEGKKLDLEECPRELLEKERITYLSAEQRANYVVDIHKGKLYWRRNGKPVDTTKGKHKDLGNGQGIVEKGEEEQQEEARLRQARREERAAQRGGSVRSISDTSDDSSVSSSDEDTEEEEERKHDAEHYGAGEKSKKKMLSSKGWTDALLRKTVGANTWIYVINSRYELYVGIKQTGKFQHSSFLFGGRVLSAGLLKAKDGVLTSLSPLSGHYRAGTAHFRHFVASLQESGVDLEHVTLSKSLLMLYALEKYGKVSKKLKPKKGKKNEDEKEVEKHHHTQRTEAKKEEEATLSKSQSNASDVGQQGKKHHHWLHLPRPSASSSSLSDAASAASISSTPSSPRVKTARDKPKTLLERTKESRRAKEGLSAPTSDVEASPRSSTDGTLSRLMHKTGLRKD